MAVWRWLHSRANASSLVRMTQPPIIGFTLDHETKDTYSKLPWYAIRQNYLQSASDAGATPVALGHDVRDVDAYLNLIDGLVIIGGDFDIDPALYGGGPRHKTVTLKQSRTAFEWAITKGALARNMPILGICGGQQLLNVVLGGTLIQHIPDVMDSEIAHEQPNPRNEVGHSVTILRHSLLYEIVGEQTIGVNSAHHQAAAEVAPECIISAKAPDGIIEAIELPTDQHPFCLGVQWHPEYHVTEADTKIWQAFIDAARAYGARP